MHDFQHFKSYCCEVLYMPKLNAYLLSLEFEESQTFDLLHKEVDMHFTFERGKQLWEIAARRIWFLEKA